MSTINLSGGDLVIDEDPLGPATRTHWSESNQSPVNDAGDNAICESTDQLG